MRFRTLVLWVLFAAAVIWAGFVAVGVGSGYFTVQELVDGAIKQTVSKRKAQASIGMPMTATETAGDLRAGIVAGLRHTGLRYDETGLTVEPQPGGIRVHIAWAYPVVTYDDQAYLAIPMTVERIVSVGN